VLHPRYKSTYFLKAKWPCDWIKTAELLQNEWETNYKTVLSPPSTSSPQVSSAYVQAASLEVKVIWQQTSALRPASKYFAVIGKDMDSDGDVVTEWLSSPPVPSVADPIAWWSKMNAVGHPLARMALDFLSAPGMYQSIVVEATTKAA
jgi:hypothetical protein